MKFYLWFGFMFVVIVWYFLHCNRVGNARTDRPVKYIAIDDDSATEAYWKHKSDSLNIARR